jgi:hypothetical protein
MSGGTQRNPTDGTRRFIGVSLFFLGPEDELTPIIAFEK